MNIILITVLSTLIGACLVVFLAWLGITSYRLMKFKERAENSFKHLERWIDDNQNTIIKELEIRDIEEQKKVDDLYQRVTQVYPDIYRTVDTHVANLNSKIDSRCDKLQEQLKK